MISRREMRIQRNLVQRSQAVLIPRFFEWAFCGILLVSGIASVPMLGKFGPLPITDMLDVWLVILFGYLLFQRSLHARLALAVIGAYFLVIAILFLLGDAPLYDFLQAYRWVFYLAVLAVGVGKHWADVKLLTWTTFSLVFLALIKATLTYFLIGSGERPGLLLENNYEIALFCGIGAVIVTFVDRRARLGFLAAVGVLVFLGGSRSGAVIFAILCIYMLTQLGLPRKVLRYAFFFATPVIVAAPIVIFYSRLTSVRIDRLNFLDAFLYDMSDRSLTGWLFGAAPITPLSPHSCQALSYYQKLFSSAGNGECYSVIYHAFILRLIYDSGVLGLLIVSLVLFAVLYAARVRLGLALALVLTGFANSLSVSGWNNPYIVIPVLLAIVTSYRQGTTVTPADENFMNGGRGSRLDKILQLRRSPQVVS